MIWSGLGGDEDMSEGCKKRMDSLLDFLDEEVWMMKKTLARMRLEGTFVPGRCQEAVKEAQGVLGSLIVGVKKIRESMEVQGEDTKQENQVGTA